MKTNIITTALFAVLSIPASAVVNIDYVTVGDAGNAADPATGSLYGAVAYDYRIAKNETTISQYAEFLNAVAKTDTNGLYGSFSLMANDGNIAGIQRIGTSGNYSYSVIGSGNRPITYTSWFDAARFCNWLHNGQPSGGQTALTTEDGAYTLNGATSGVSFAKNVGATVWIPSESEWYKAAYYDPTKNAGAGGYWLQANQSDTMSSNSPLVAGAANYYDGDFAVTQSSSYSAGQNYLTEVGSYGTDSESYYGTNDMAGNVEEWTDSVRFGDERVFRESSWGMVQAAMGGSSRKGSGYPTIEYQSLGFRLASAIPEPTTGLLAILGLLPLLLRRRA